MTGEEDTFESVDFEYLPAGTTTNGATQVIVVDIAEGVNHPIGSAFRSQSSSSGQGAPARGVGSRQRTGRIAERWALNSSV